MAGKIGSGYPPIYKIIFRALTIKCLSLVLAIEFTNTSKCFDAMTYSFDWLMSAAKSARGAGIRFPA